MSDIRESIRRMNEFCDELERIVDRLEGGGADGESDALAEHQWQTFISEHPELGPDVEEGSR